MDGDRLFFLGAEGDLACLETASGKVVWSKNLAKDFGGELMSEWGFSEAPLVDGDKLRILVEKDFVCLTGREDEDESDMYPHPKADEQSC